MADVQRTQASVSSARPLTGLNRGARVVFWASALLLAAGVAFQVFLAGAAVLVDASYWSFHRNFAHVIELFPILIFIIGLVARIPLRVNLINGLYLLVFTLQYVFLYAMPALGLPLLRGLHAANAITLFLIPWYLARMSRPLMDEGR